MNSTDIQSLLNEIKLISTKYNNLNKEIGLNIFKTLRRKSDEVNLHSRFIFELLNPKGSHKKGRLFFDAFLDICGLKPDDYAKAEVKREFNRIDLLIISDNKGIIIENKIWAKDQNKQLENYHQFLLDKKIESFKIYLTLDGRIPSSKSLGNLDGSSIMSLSYSKHIVNWLDACSEEIKDSPFMIELLKQYKNIISELTGNSMNEIEKKELFELVKQNDNILHASKINNSWRYFKRQTELLFWQDLKEVILLDEMKILPNQIFSKDKIDKAARGKRRKDTWYGLMYKLFDYENDQFCLFVERGPDFHYYGITVVPNEVNSDRRICSSTKYSLVRESLSKYGTTTDTHWLVRRFFSRPISFSIFRNDETLNLVNDSKREAYINDLWLEIKAFVNECNVQKLMDELNYSTDSSS